MSLIYFTKMHGAGNDFIVMDNRFRRINEDEARAMARRVCPRRTGIGSDGLILLEISHRTDFRMRHFNPDGSLATFCGNGARCLVRFAQRIGLIGTRTMFEADDGRHEATITGQDVNLKMVNPSEIVLNQTISDGHGIRVLHTMNTGTHHTIIFSKNIETENIEQIGQQIRYHQMFQPKGTNVNFVQKMGPTAISVRTYERGVEAETLSCGTGAVASALTAALLEEYNPPVTVQTHSGENLIVDFKKQNGTVREPILQGSAHVVFDGEISEV